MTSLKGKKVWITGASGGLGQAIAEVCARRGASLVLIARSEEKLKKTASRCMTIGAGQAAVYPFDLRKTSEVPDFVNHVLEAEGSVDVLVNNAGFGLFETLEKTDEDVIKGMFDVNVLSLILMSRGVLPAMERQGSGHIVNIASQAGKIATPKSTIYAATKHAVLGFSNSLRMETADRGILVTTVNPGPIDTNFFDSAEPSGNYASKVKKWMLSPQKVAEKTVDSFFTGTREINLPGWMNAASRVYALAPGAVERIGKKGFNQK
ncbi:SDR family oxidoreductase [Jeotgalibacillus sp. R-1-5s-1]|uniref:SDR family NAD(P)-dependent oxidoreductase n=1 Tax=Jeotgalibacillus sp. R-1-5s-1 TaxID=2555897 RepID=UPI00106A2FDD|nr:SDR family oxidoreductase [Jeotgalibacillus sp. R-1-5s-1]TFD92209.1 SDR family oxidoreductase [Jeotgalibacillus sp. R-1-5s-1]